LSARLIRIFYTFTNWLPEVLHATFFKSIEHSHFLSSYMAIIINLSFFCYQIFHLSSFCKAISIYCYDSCCVAVLLSFKTLKNISTWAILLLFLCLMVKSYCWSLHNYQAFLLDDRFTVRCEVENWPIRSRYVTCDAVKLCRRHGTWNLKSYWLDAV